MNLQSYLKLRHLLEHDTSKKEERRAFFLKHKIENLSKTKQLLFWMDKARHHAPQSISHLKSLTGLFLFVTFIFGVLSAVALLSYHGEEPVNVIYFFTIAVIVPIFSMFLSLFALFFTHSFTPFFLSLWVEKIIAKFFSSNAALLKIDKQLKYSFSFFNIQMGALLFSLGLLFGFLAVIFTHDIAFGWSSTLNIDAHSFYNFLNSLSFVYKPFCPQSGVSLELIQKSHYFRLGQQISQQMQESASLFGEWWKFLACTTLFYAIFLRLFFLLFAFIKLQRNISKAILRLDGTEELLRDMNEPLISTTAETNEATPQKEKSSALPIQKSETHYYAILGWAFSEDELIVTADALHLHAQNRYAIGGNKSLQEENALISLLKEDILLLVKAWEIPTMEFIDLLEELSLQVKSVVVYPLGYANKSYTSDHKERNLWEQKIAAQNFNNVSIQK